MRHQYMKNKRIVACVILHYGAEWFTHALRSVQDCVDEVVVVYSAKPSFGHVTNEQCPESEDMLKACVKDWHNVTWYRHETFKNEGFHRDWAYNECRVRHNADYMIVADPDEIWDTQMLVDTLVWADNNFTTKYLHVGMQHFWRSVGYVCRDPIIPIRIINFNAVEGEQYAPNANTPMIHHMGYAQSNKIVQYKWKIHGHFYELRNGWLGKFANWKPMMLDVHPTNKDFWHPAAFDRVEIKHLIGDHPYYNLDIIP